MKKSAGYIAVKNWLRSKKWKLADFQEETMEALLQRKNGLLNAPTGSGKTYALFLPILVQYINTHPDYKTSIPGHLRVLWVTPLRALTRDIQRNLQLACDELQVPWRVSIRTGDTSTAEKNAQAKRMPEVLLTTPESMHLLFAQKNHTTHFKHLDVIVCDEWHEVLGTKRGVQTELVMAHLRKLRPAVLSWGISATIGNMEQALDVLLGKHDPEAVIIRSGIKKKVVVKSVLPDHIDKLPWAGYLGTRLLDKVMPVIRKSKATLLFTNTRSQTEIWYRMIVEHYPEMAGLIALHHGSLDNELRNWVEEAIHNGRLKLVVCTSSLDLGVDFRPVETVIQVGSPKSIARFLQRAGRSGHRPGAVSTVYFVPTHALELIEAVSLREGVEEETAEERVPVLKAFDVLAQYMVTIAVGDGFKEAELFEEIRDTFCYKSVTRKEWEWLLGFITTGSPTLKAYDEFKKVEQEGDLYVVKNRRIAMRHRFSMGTIVSDTSMKVKFVSGKYLGSIEEYFIARLKPGDVFSFAGMNLEFVRVHDMTAQVRKAGNAKGIVPSWQGGRIPLSSQLSRYIRKHLDRVLEKKNPEPEIELMLPLLQLQAERSAIPNQNQLLIETCQTSEGYHLFVYPFEGRLVHEGMAALLAYRISRSMPLSFSMAMNDYGFELLSDVPVRLEELLEELPLFETKNLLEDILSSVNETEMARRKFRDIASISGLVFHGYPGRQQATTKHIQASSSLLFNAISDFETGNLLILQAHREALEQQLEEQRLREALQRISKQEFIFTYPAAPSPFAFPILVDRLREQMSSETLEDRVARLLVQSETQYGTGDQA